MNCPCCGRWAAPDDPETGADFNEICGFCADDGWTRTAQGDVINLNEAPDPAPTEQADGYSEPIKT